MKKKSEDAKYTKTNLPSKICQRCGKPMAWRKRWAKVWEQVKYCSERCRRHKTAQSSEKSGD
jgi:hypothetical protein